MVVSMKGQVDKWACTGRYLPSGMFPALKAASPVAFFWRAVSKFLSIVSGSVDIVVEEERWDERNTTGVDSYGCDYCIRVRNDVLLS